MMKYEGRKFSTNTKVLYESLSNFFFHYNTNIFAVFSIKENSYSLHILQDMVLVWLEPAATGKLKELPHSCHRYFTLYKMKCFTTTTTNLKYYKEVINYTIQDRGVPHHACSLEGDASTQTFELGECVWGCVQGNDCGCGCRGGCGRMFMQNITKNTKQNITFLLPCKHSLLVCWSFCTMIQHNSWRSFLSPRYYNIFSMFHHKIYTYTKQAQSSTNGKNTYQNVLSFRATCCLLLPPSNLFSA